MLVNFSKWTLIRDIPKETVDNKNGIEGVTKNHTIKEFSTNTFIIFQLTSVCFQTVEFHLTHLLDADDRFNHRSTALQPLLVVQWSSVSSKSDS